MKLQRYLYIGLFFLSTLILTAYFYVYTANKIPPPSAATPSNEETVILTQPNTFSVIPDQVPVNTAQAKLGKILFYDPRLSKDNTVACINCHNLNQGGADKHPLSKGIKQQLGANNAPTVFNAVFNLAQNWNGSAASLAEQAKGPLFNPVEMGNTTPEKLLTLFKTDPTYQRLFKDAFNTDTPTLKMALHALDAFESTLTTPNSRFDQFLKGNFKTLNTQELRGYQLFQNLGCVACHNGINLGSNMFQIAGIFKPISSSTENSWPDRSQITGSKTDHLKMKVPTLRNIIATAPYFHDGSAATLEDAIKTMAESQLGQPISSQNIQDIKAFLITLTGQYQHKYIAPLY